MFDFLWRLAVALGVAILLDWLWRHRNGSPDDADAHIESIPDGAGTPAPDAPLRGSDETTLSTVPDKKNPAPDSFDFIRSAKAAWDGFLAWIRRVDWKRVAAITIVVLGALWKIVVWLFKNGSKLAGDYSYEKMAGKNVQDR